MSVTDKMGDNRPDYQFFIMQGYINLFENAKNSNHYD